MSWQDTMVSVALVSVALVAGAWAVKNYLVDPAGEAGAWVGQHVLTPVYWTAQYPGTAVRGILEGWGVPEVPPTPAGYLPSNWTWVQPGTQDQPVYVGLPAGMTMRDFCRVSPPGTRIGCEAYDAEPVPWWQDISLRW